MKYKSVLGKTIELTAERKKHILLYHPDIKSYFQIIKEVLLESEEIRSSKSDPKVLLFYKFFVNILGGKYISVTVKTNGRWFILTAFLTKRKLSGEEYDY